MPRQVELGSSQDRTRVVAGILRNPDRQVLISDRLRCGSMRELWEFPGGKVENDESARAALRRELIEELGIIELETEHFLEAKHDYAEIRVSIEFFIVTAWKGTPTGKEGQRLRWVAVNELDAGLLLPADVAVVEALRELR